MVVKFHVSGHTKTMDTYSAAIILGIIQGLTEFLPVSSTGHLIIFEKLLGTEGVLGISFDIAVHTATALAVILYFRREWWSIITSFFSRKDSEGRKLLLLIIVGTIPAGIAGIFFETAIITRFRTIGAVIAGLIAGSVLIGFAEYWHRRKLGPSPHAHKALTPVESFFISIFQALALFPGISRSGATISGGLLLGKERLASTRFSFLLATPIILGASLKRFSETSFVFDPASIPLFAVGFLAAFFSGLLALKLLTYMMHHRTLTPFIWYRLALAALLLIFFY